MTLFDGDFSTVISIPLLSVQPENRRLLNSPDSYHAQRPLIPHKTRSTTHIPPRHPQRPRFPSQNHSKKSPLGTPSDPTMEDAILSSLGVTTQSASESSNRVINAALIKSAPKIISNGQLVSFFPSSTSNPSGQV